MRYKFGWIALLIAFLSTAAARGQSPPVEELRQQIQALQDQLQKLETRPAGNRRVSEVGGSREPERARELVLRMYDVSDLFAVAPAYPAMRLNELTGSPTLLFAHPAGSSGDESAMGSVGGMGGGMGGMGGGVFSVPDGRSELPPTGVRVLAQMGGAGGGGASTRTSLSRLVEAITSTIAPTSWDEVGGSSSITTLGTTLLVSASPQTHQQIENLLNLFRERWHSLRTISVRACWLWMSDARALPLLMADRADAAGESYGVIPAEEWKDLLTEAAQADPTAVGYRAALTCYNGQTVSAVSGLQSLAVIGFDPDVKTADKTSAVAFRPVVKELAGGAVLQVTPVATQNAKYVVLDIHSHVSLVSETRSEKRYLTVGPSALAPAAVASALDRPVVSTQQFSTTLRAPVDRVQFVGGLTFEGAPDPQRPHLMLFVRTTVQELRDDPKPREAKDEPGPANQSQ